MTRSNASFPTGCIHVAADIAILCACILLLGFGGAKISNEHDLGAGPTAMPQVVYVTDFDLDVGKAQSKPGLIQSLRPHVNILSKQRSGQKDPAARAREIVDLMSTSLVKELIKLGLNAQHVNSDEALPGVGLLVRGVFTQVDQGNHLRRTIIGFGAGETELQLIVSVADLSQGSPTPFYEIDTTAESRKLPGAVITLNPYVAAAKFVLSSRDLDRNVTQTASKVAAEIVGRIRKQGVN